MGAKLVTMCAKDATMCAKVATMSAKDATMCAKVATMCAKDATMCAKDASMCGMDATMCVKGCDHVRMVGFALMNEFEDPQILEGQGQSRQASRRRLTYPVASYTNSRAPLDRLRAYALRDLKVYTRRAA